MHALRFWRKLHPTLRCPINNSRSSSLYKRRSDVLPPPDQLEQLRATFFEARTALEKSEWQQVRQTLFDNYRHINQNNVDAVILGVCNESKQLPLAKDYIRFLQESGATPNDATLGRLLRIYNGTYHARGGQADALSATEQNEVLSICTQLQTKHELLDATTCEQLIHGLVTTCNWLEAVKLLNMFKRSQTTVSLIAYTELALKAFTMAEPELGWRLLQEMVAVGKQPKCEIYLAALTHMTTVAELERLLRFLEHYDLLITYKVAEAIANCVQTKWPGEVNVTQAATLDRLGKCSACNVHLQHVAISEQEFERLREAFLKQVLVGKDVFRKSTPDELKRFEGFLKETAPYDCVIDGLNVAYSTGANKPPKELAGLLAAVVRYFMERRKHVLVLGRQHMKTWSKKAMQYVYSNASVFLTHNLSQDDPFLLWAALHSGPATDFFSRDLMRSHAHLLGVELKAIFRRWQQEHQYSLVTHTGAGKIIVKEPIRHRLSAHKLTDTWHIPCRAAYVVIPAENFEVPERWLCLTIKQQFQKKNN